ncbi:hypothetical protein F2Q69_00029262 [Brassica cretica]|uniref:Uncharacterized protein n=1 Tax=Brassica cretica TaxID=69181 RepID=A0A8S9RWI9_BRACR|nr:hypothetical protein F2Q69_00029262 [Brassica cretica]
MSSSRYRTKGVIQVSSSSMAEISSFCGSTRVAGHWRTNRGMLIWVCVLRADRKLARASACEFCSLGI